MSINGSMVAPSTKESNKSSGPDRYLRMPTELKASNLQGMFCAEEVEKSLEECDEDMREIFGEDEDGTGWFGKKPEHVDRMLKDADTP